MDYYGDLMGIFNLSTIEKVYNKRKKKEIEKKSDKWSRVILDRWYAPTPRRYSPQEINLEKQATHSQGLNSNFLIQNSKPLSSQDLFVWKDTLTNIRSFLLNEAVVKAKNLHRYKGLNFSRYTYEGGEKKGYRYMDQYWNVALELERAKDRGLDFYSMQDFFSYMLDNNPLAYDTSTFVHGNRTDDGPVGPVLSEIYIPKEDDAGRTAAEKPSDIISVFKEGRDDNDMEWMEKMHTVFYRGREVKLIVNNGVGAVGGNGNGGGIETHPEEVKSCMLTSHYYSDDNTSDLGTPVLFVYTREDWHKWRQKKGITKRHIWGYAEPVAFPRLNYYELPADNPQDYRRTLYWAPTLHTDAAGHASAIFFSNARGDQQLSISISGLTKDGEIISYER